MDPLRRRLLRFAGALPLAALANDDDMQVPHNDHPDRLVLTDFRGPEPVVMPGAEWAGFSDRVMGGVSTSEFRLATIDGVRCARLTGEVTRDQGGGFVQMALALGRGRTGFDASAWSGIELRVHGNDEDYNVHLRTADVRWYSQSYRATVHLAPRWQTVRLAWADFVPHQIDSPLDTTRLSRIGLLGWMREFHADLALAEIVLYA